MTEINPRQEVKEKVLVASNVEMLEILAELIGEGKVVRVCIKGKSMLPFLHDGLDYVELSKPSDNEIIPGTIVMFRYGSEFVVHRIIRRKNNILTLRGDNISQWGHEVVSTDHVIGIVRKIYYSGGKILNMNTRYWRILSGGWQFTKSISKWPLQILFKLNSDHSKK